MAQWVKDLVWSLLWLWWQLWHRFDPWPGNCCIRVHGQKKKKTLTDLFKFTKKLELVTHSYAVVASLSDPLHCIQILIQSLPQWTSKGFYGWNRVRIKYDRNASVPLLLLSLSDLLLGKTVAISRAAPWKCLHREELKPPANSHVSEPSPKEIFQPQWNLQMTTAQAVFFFFSF